MARYTMGTLDANGNAPVDEQAQEETPKGRYQVGSISDLKDEEAMPSKPGYDPKQYGMDAVYKAREAPETMLPEPLAIAARGAGSFATGALGMPGDLANLATRGVDWASRKLGVNEGEGTNTADYVPDILTSKGMKEKVIDPLLKSQAEPTSKFESGVDDFLDFLGGISSGNILSTAGKVEKAIQFGKSAIAAGVSTGAKEAVNYFVSPKNENGVLSQAAGLVGLVGTLGYMSKGKLPKNVMKDLYGDAEASIENARVKGFKIGEKGVGRNILDLTEEAKAAVPTGGDNGALFKQIEKAANAEKGGFISINHMVDVKKALNKEMSKRLRQGDSISNMLKTVKGLKEYITRYGKSYNPDFLDAYTKADEMFGAITGAESIASFASKIIPGSKSIYKMNPLVRGLVGASALAPGAIANAPLTALGAATYLPANELVKGLSAAWRSPLVKKATLEFFKAAGKNNKVLGLKALNRIGDAAEEEGLI